MSEPRVVVTHYHPRAVHGDGGVSNALWAWCDSFQRAGYLVQVLHDGRLAANPSRAVTAPTLPVRHRGRGRWTRPIGLAESLARGTVLILHSGYQIANLAAGRDAFNHDIPYVVVPHGAYDPHVRDSRAALRRVWEVAERQLLERAAGVHVFFEAEAKQVKNLAPRARLIVAPTAFDVSATQWHQPEQPRYVAWLGRYDVRHKGLDRLLDAMALLPVSDRPILIMHGRDSKNTREEVQRMVVERGLTREVQVGAPISGRAKLDLLLGAAAYVHPSQWECHSMALLEAMSLGVPCLTTSDINIAQELSRSGAAAVVKGSAIDLARGLLAAANGELTQFGSRGRTFLAAHLSHEQAVLRWREQLLLEDSATATQ